MSRSLCESAEGMIAVQVVVAQSVTDALLDHISYKNCSSVHDVNPTFNAIDNNLVCYVCHFADSGSCARTRAVYHPRRGGSRVIGT